MFVDIHGVRQRVSVHGDDRANPALLMVSGAGLALSRMAAFFEPWERAFRVVHWDQPGAGDTHDRNPEPGPITFDRLAVDGVAVAEFVRAHLQARRIALLGISGGSIVGLKMVKARPDLFSAYVGTGQIVNGIDVTESNAGLVLTAAEQASLAAMRSTGGDQRPRATAMYERLKPEMAAFCARSLGPRYDVPMFFVQGDQDTYTPTREVVSFEREIAAPAKALAIVEGGGHAVVFMRDRFLQTLKELKVG